MKNSHVLHLLKRLKYWTPAQEVISWVLVIYKWVEKKTALGKISQLFD